ncbi:MAG: C40 family peptidase [Micrococcales bacterium]|nr:C40 family peptidase [Micrococcales bacterium]
MTLKPLTPARRTMAIGAAAAALIAPVALGTAAPASAATMTYYVSTVDELAQTRVNLTPYRYGGTNFYYGADCSGFTQSAYKKRGNMYLPRTAAQQRAFVKRISRSSAIPGDLVFFHSGSTGYSSNVYHVAIWDGSGYIIDASSSKGKVVRRTLWTSNVSFGTKR